MATKKKSPAPEICSICKVERREHEKAEIAGDLHHRFNADGRLVAVKDEKKTDPPPMSRVPEVKLLTGPSDPILRVVLINKGVISPEDLTAAEEMLISTGLLEAAPPKS